MKRLMILSLVLFFSASLYAQVAINNDGAPADSSAMLDVQSTNKGLLVPRITTRQQIDIFNPAAGLIIFNTDSSDFYGYTGTTWVSFRNPSDTINNFDCGQLLVDPRDSQSYGTVLIDGKCWMAENLNVGTMVTSAASDNGIIEKFCYDNNSGYCSNYGGLYEWQEMMGYSTDTLVQGICPPGWHVPTEYEWCAITTYVDATVNCSANDWTGTDAGTKLKSASGWSSGGNGTDDVGFNGLPGGVRTNYGDFYDNLSYGYWWSSAPNGGSAWNRRVRSASTDIARFYNTNTYGMSVWCVKD